MPITIPKKLNSPLTHLLKNDPGLLATLKHGDLVEAVFLSKGTKSAYFDLGRFGTGIVYGREYYRARDLIKSLKTGDVVMAKVVEMENEDGYVELSLEQADKEMIWREAEELRKTKQAIEIPVVEANKGGLVLAWKGLTGFLPASQLRASHYPRVEGGEKEKILEELKKFVGQTMAVTVLSTDLKEEKIIFSEKNVETAEIRELVSQYHVGDEIAGAVTGVVDFGVFVRIKDGLEGLVHISELDWGLVNNPSDLYHESEQVRAKIIGIEAGKISLSIKALKPNPWKTAAERYHKGDIVQGVVVRLDRYGALVSIEEGVAGLSHISEFKSEREMRELLELGKSYPFQILHFDSVQRQLTLGFLGREWERASGEQVQPLMSNGG